MNYPEKIITNNKKRGRKKKFAEETKVFAVRLPKSRYDELKTLILSIINEKPYGY